MDSRQHASPELPGGRAARTSRWRARGRPRRDRTNPVALEVARRVALPERWSRRQESLMQMSRRSMLVGSGAALVGLGAPRGAAASRSEDPGGHREDHGRSSGLPIVIGHRGSPAYRPEHTVGSYTLAIEMDADYIEPDLVFTKDGELVARHEPDIGGTTDVADHPEFADRRRSLTIDGVAYPDTWFSFDFTLAELRTLRAKERLPDVRPQNTALNGIYQVPTFQEVIDLAKANGVGIYPETKHPTFFQSLGFDFDAPLLGTL